MAILRAEVSENSRRAPPIAVQKAVASFRYQIFTAEQRPRSLDFGAPNPRSEDNGCVEESLMEPASPEVHEEQITLHARRVMGVSMVLDRIGGFG